MLNNKKILIIRLSAIGDTIHTLPMVYALKNQYPKCEIGWVVESKAKLFVENNPSIDKCFIIDKNRKNFFEIIKQIRKEKYDIALDTQQLFKSGIILGICGAKQKITLSGGREFSWIFANKIVKAKTKLFDINYHVVKRNLELCEYIGCKTNEIGFPIPIVSSEEKENVESILPKGKLIVAIAPATTWKNKHISNEIWIKILDYLQEEYKDKVNVILTGSKKDDELINSIIEKSKYKNAINLCGKTNLLELLYLYSKCKLVLTPDSGSAHIAWASKEPYIIAFFSATSSKRTGPIGEKYFSIQSYEKCSPCMKKKCKNKNSKNICTASFKFEEIKKYIDTYLKNVL